MASFPQIDCKARTDVGMKRSYNQDSFHVACASNEKEWQEIGHILLVADGMGAHAVGEKASEQAVKTIPHVYSKYASEGIANSLRKAFTEANSTIHDCGMQNVEFRGMGTTASALVIRPEGAWIGHVGDSRVYRIRGKAIEQLTYDHSLVWEYARLKKLDPDQVKEIPSNYINRCLGPESHVEPDVDGPYPIEPGDKFLLCSDGLSGLIKDQEIGAITSILSPEQACRCLIDLANLRGGHDNITVIIGAVPYPSGSNNNSTPILHNSVATKNISDSIFGKLVLKLGIPWWVFSFLAGAITALGAIIWLKNGLEGGGFEILLILSIVFLVIGFFGLGFMIYQNNNQNSLVEYFPTPTAKIHRYFEIQLNSKQIEKVRLQLLALKKRAEENAWQDVPWDAFQAELHQANDFENNKDLSMALRHYCLAWGKLSPSWIKNRKNEPPIEQIWDKNNC